MRVTELDVPVTRSRLHPNPIRDALQSLPGASSVRVTLHTEGDVKGVGEVGFGRGEGHGCSWRPHRA